MKDLFYKMITSGSGVSSKRLVGAVCYLILTISLVVLLFVNPDFSGLENIFITMIITTASLLGITTIENISKIGKKNPEDNKN